MDKFEEHKYPKVLSDEYGNQHYVGDELARGGQGVVFRTIEPPRDFRRLQLSSRLES